MTKRPSLKRSIVVSAVVIVMSILSNQRTIYAQQTQSSPEERILAIHRIILSWLHCEECTSAQLMAVVQLGPKAVPYLTSALQDGPTLIEQVSLRRFLQRRYAELQKYVSSHTDASLPMTEKEYISFHTSQLTTQYQVRAATALGAIGGPSAIQALKLSANQELSREVLDVVKHALFRNNVLTP